jgi:hypothetical protein
MVANIPTYTVILDIGLFSALYQLMALCGVE